MTAAARHRLALTASVVSLLVLTVLLASLWFYSRLRASLPRLDGIVLLPGISSTVTVTRDANGVPTLNGASRVDLARALGYLHAQDRFFQMDLLRRQAAGELAELFGADALPLDKAARVHGFRKLAGEVIDRAAPVERELIEAYADGVNAGLADLGDKPFEYIVLRSDPRPWSPEDSVLVIYAMTLTLKDDQGRYEHSLATLRDTFGQAAMDFFAPLMQEGDASLDGSVGSPARIPGPQAIDLRREQPAVSSLRSDDDSRLDMPLAGSNSFALAASRSASGGALLASAMHLTLPVPNTWYRAQLEWAGNRVTGVTLPGLPTIVAGSNSHVAWSFTNAPVDTSDLAIVQVFSSELSGLYWIGRDLVPVERRHETILVKGDDPVEIDIPWTVWGPIVGKDATTRPLALHWIAHNPEATDLTLGRLETAPDVDTALSIARRAGIPAQNFLVAGSDGRIAWAIAGRLPDRSGFDGRVPVSWSYGDRTWQGLLSPEEVPAVLDPTEGQLWTANNRILGGDALSILGDGGYGRPARARQIENALSGLRGAQPADLLRIQLDDRALFLSRWRELMLSILGPENVSSSRSRQALRAEIERWDGRASVGSTSYRIVRDWRRAVARLALDPIFARCFEIDSGFSWGDFDYEPALWAIVSEKPPHLLSPRFGSWETLLLAAADEVSNSLASIGLTPAQATWGRRNTLQMVHPLAAALPSIISDRLGMPAEELPGDNDMPRVQGPDFGASERFVVSPGHEEDGISQMPGGQSGHPLSPFFRAGHETWVRGEPAPFLPGPATHTLAFRPPGPVRRGSE